MAYTKVSKEDVYKVLVSTSLEVMNPMGGTINLVNLASLLKTSRYQVKKHIDVMKNEGLVELKIFSFSNEYETFPPYWGYRLTEKGKDTDYYREQNKKHNKILQECY